MCGGRGPRARKYGLKFGVYLSPWDRHEPRYKDSAAYDSYYQAELTELASNYGDLVEFWLDGAGSEVTFITLQRSLKLCGLISQHHCVCRHRPV